MLRRSFFGRALAALGFGAATGGNAPGSGAAVRGVTFFAPFDPPRDANGNAVCRVYRRDAAGVWRMIRPADVREGDHIILVGQAGDRLFRCEEATVGTLVPPRDGDAGGFVPVGEGTDLMAAAKSGAAPEGEG